MKKRFVKSGVIYNKIFAKKILSDIFSMAMHCKGFIEEIFLEELKIKTEEYVHIKKMDADYKNLILGK